MYFNTNHESLILGNHDDDLTLVDFLRLILSGMNGDFADFLSKIRDDWGLGTVGFVQKWGIHGVHPNDMSL